MSRRVPQQTAQKKSIFYIAITLSLVVVAIAAAATLFVFNRQDDTAKATPTNSSNRAKESSKFSFAGLPEWTQRVTNKNSMVVFHGHDCFISTEYHEGTIAEDKLKREKSNDYLSANGHTVKKGDSNKMTMKTPTGELSYDLQQFYTTTPDDDGQPSLKAGTEYGYIPLETGYVKVQGQCDKPEQLAQTIAALKAVKFDATK